jgi:hypothetical protein
MKTMTLNLIIAVAMTSAFQAQAAFNLQDLDKLKTCKTELQKTNANTALAFLEAFSWWNAKDQMNIITPDYIAWHASLAGLLEAKPEYQGHVPFDGGQYTKDTYLETLSFIAAANDLSKYIQTPTRVDCVGNDDVVILEDFTSVQVRRDAQGCITHGTPYGSRVHLDFHLVNYSGAVGEPERRLVSRTFSHLDDKVSAKVREELAAIVGDPAHPNPPNMPENPAACKTRAQFLQDFKDQVGL